MYLFDSNTEGGKLILGASEYSESDAIQVNCNIDNGSFDQSLVVIIDPLGHAPEIFFERRIPPNSATSGLWRHFTAGIANAEGRKPLFKISRQYRDGNGTHDLAQWRCVYTQDFETWTQSSQPVLVGGGSGTYNFTFPDPLPPGNIIIAHNVYGRVQDSEELAQWLLVDNSSIAAPANPSYIDGVYARSITEDNDIGLPVGDHPRYAIKLSFPDATTDGYRKRKCVVMHGIHAAGEGQCFWAFRHTMHWLVESSDIEAQNLRANWDFYVYFDINPNGIQGGYSRVTPRSSTDPNRTWSGMGSVSSVEEVDTVKRVIFADVEGQADAYLGFHGDVYQTTTFNVWTWGLDNNPETRTELTKSFLAKGQIIFGVPPVIRPMTETTTDIWFGNAVLGAKISFNCETPSMAGSTTEFFGEIGKNWFKTLQAVDQAGEILPETTLQGASVHQANKSTQGQIAQSNTLAGDNVAQGNKSTGSSVSSQNDLIGVDASQSNLSAQGQITSAGSLSGADVEQENKSSEGAVETSIYLLGNSVAQQNASTAWGVEVSGTLAGADVIQNNKSTAGQIAGAGSLFGSDSVQNNTSSDGVISSSSTIAGDNCQQANTSSQGPIVVIPGLVGDDVAQDNLSTQGAITAAVELSCSNVISINRSSAGQIPYTEAWLSGDDCQQVNKSTQVAVSEGMLLFGDNVIQGNFSSRGRVNVTDILANADVEGKIWMALKRHIEAI